MFKIHTLLIIWLMCKTRSFPPLNYELVTVTVSFCVSVTVTVTNTDTVGVPLLTIVVIDGSASGPPAFLVTAAGALAVVDVVPSSRGRRNSFVEFGGGRLVGLLKVCVMTTWVGWMEDKVVGGEGLGVVVGVGRGVVVSREGRTGVVVSGSGMVVVVEGERIDIVVTTSDD